MLRMVSFQTPLRLRAQLLGYEEPGPHRRMTSVLINKPSRTWPSGDPSADARHRPEEGSGDASPSPQDWHPRPSSLPSRDPRCEALLCVTPSQQNRSWRERAVVHASQSGGLVAQQSVTGTARVMCLGLCPERMKGAPLSDERGLALRYV